MSTNSPRRIPRRIFNSRSGQWETHLVTICPPPGDPLLPRPPDLEDPAKQRAEAKERFGRRGPYNGRAKKFAEPASRAAGCRMSIAARRQKKLAAEAGELLDRALAGRRKSDTDQ